MSDWEITKAAPAAPAASDWVVTPPAKPQAKAAPAVATAPPDPSAGANPVADAARSLLGIDPSARFSFSNLRDNLLDTNGEQIVPMNASGDGLLERLKAEPTGKPATDVVPWSPRELKKREEAGPFRDDWGAQSIVGGLVGGAAGRAAKALGPIASAVIEGAVGNKVQGGDATTGGLVGGTIGSLGPLGRAVMKSRGGMARKFIEDRGGKVGVLTPGSGGPFDEMVTKGTTDADIGRQSATSAEKGLGMLNAQDAARKRPIGEHMDQIDRSPAGEEPRNIDALHARLNEDVNRIGAQPRAESTLGWALDEMDRANAGRFQGQPEVREPHVTRQSSAADPTPALEKILGRRLDQASPEEVQAAFRTLKSNEKLADEALRAGKPVPDRLVQSEVPADPRTLKESELNRIRRGVSERGGIGKSVGGEHATERDAASMLRSMVDEGPYREANREYSRAAFTNRKDRRLLGITETRRGPEETQSAVDKVANTIGRRGQQTITAGKGIDRLAQFDRRNPDIGLELSKPAMLRSKADLSFRLGPKEHGGLIDRGASIGGMIGGAEIISSMLGHGHVSPLKAAIAATMGLALKNAPAIEGRLLYPGAKALSGGAAEKLIPLFAAARAAQERQ